MPGGLHSQTTVTPPTSVPPGADSVGSLPDWLLIALLVLVTLVIFGMFGLTLYNLSAPRSTLKNILGLRRGHKDDQRKQLTALFTSANTGSGAPQTPSTAALIDTLGRSARVGNRTTRTILAITGFSLLGIVVVAAFGLSGPGVRDLRSQVVAAITTLVAAIVGFYFGSQSNRAAPRPQDGAAPGRIPPTLTGEDKTKFTVGNEGAYIPLLSGIPAPTVKMTSEPPLPQELKLDEATGVISGRPTTVGTYNIVLTASNGVSPDATLNLTLSVVEPSPQNPREW